MVKLKSRESVYVVMRHDFDGKDVVIAVSDNLETADALEGSYQQEFIDKGITMDESYFYTVLTSYYK